MVGAAIGGQHDGMRTVSAAVGLAIAAVLVAPLSTTATADTGHCARMERVRVPLAEHQRASCLTDLTTAGTVASGHTDPADWAGLNAPGTVNPTGVPGIQVDGYFPDSSTGNTNNGWNHDSQFVLRLPDRWNGGLVVSGAPGVREQYANDFVIADRALADGYAFAATDKGNTGVRFFADGRRPGDAIAEWNARVTQLAITAKAAVLSRYGRLPSRTVAAGISNGGYLVRWQLENNPWLYDVGVDWEGTLFTQDANLLTLLPPALRGYQRILAGDPGGRDEIIAAGYPAETEFLWPFHHQYYWDFTQRVYREELDPTFDGALEAGIPFCASGTPNCDADYDYAARGRDVRRAIGTVDLTGRIGRPMITLHGTLDTLLPIRDSDTYARLVREAGRGHLHRYYRFEGGTHVDGLYPLFPDRVRPLLPCYDAAFAAAEGWLAGTRPPADATIPRPAGGDLVNSCVLVA
jgi:hypothetical protein